MTSEKFEAIILIAGNSSRLQLSYNKNFHTINGKPIFRYSLDEFLKVPQCDKIILVYREGEREIVDKYTYDIPQTKLKLVVGGATRQDSVYQGLLAATSNLVLIHDGARPMIRRTDIHAIYQELIKGNPCCLGYKAQDTIKEMEKGKLTTLDRQKLYLVQTPQGVYRDNMIEAIIKATKENFIAYDDLSLLERYFGVTPIIISGSPYNLKITTIEDIEYITKILGEKNEV